MSPSVRIASESSSAGGPAASTVSTVTMPRPEKLFGRLTARHPTAARRVARRDPASRSVRRGSHAPAPARSARARPSSTGPAVVATTARTVPPVRRAATSRPSTVMRASTRGRAGSVTSTWASTVRWGPIGPRDHRVQARGRRGHRHREAGVAQHDQAAADQQQARSARPRPASACAIRRGAAPEASTTSTASPATA